MASSTRPPAPAHRAPTFLTRRAAPPLRSELTLAALIAAEERHATSTPTEVLTEISAQIDDLSEQVGNRMQLNRALTSLEDVVPALAREQTCVSVSSRRRAS